MDNPENRICPACGCAAHFVAVTRQDFHLYKCPNGHVEKVDPNAKRRPFGNDPSRVGGQIV